MQGRFFYWRATPLHRPSLRVPGRQPSDLCSLDLAPRQPARSRPGVLCAASPLTTTTSAASGTSWRLRPKDPSRSRALLLCRLPPFLMFHVFSWNARGLNNPGKRSLVKSVVSKYKKSVLCFQESKVETVSRSFLRSFVGTYFDKCHFVKSERASGGIITCWSSLVFSCTEVLMRNFSLTVRLKCLSSGVDFYVTNVYGPPSWDHKEDFCNKLSGLKGICGGLWVICGDFNLTRNLQERRGRTWCTRLMGLFTDLINALEMIDLPMGN